MRQKPRVAKFIFVCNAILLAMAVIIQDDLASGQAQFDMQSASQTPSFTPTPEYTPEPTPQSYYPVPLALQPNTHFYFSRPILGLDDKWLTSFFRYGSIDEDTLLPHTGIDTGMEEGTPVLASARGVVVWAGPQLFAGSYSDQDPYGLAVVIQHDFGYQGLSLFTVYSHLSTLNVSRGQPVEAGALIALSGNTGQSSAPHLHFEVRMGQNSYFNTYNPELWTVPPEGTGVLVGRMTTTYSQKLSNQWVRLTHLDTGDIRYGYTYGDLQTVNPDPYYDENLVVGELPAGEYQLLIPYENTFFYEKIRIEAGKVTFINFNGYFGMNTETPEADLPSILPSRVP